MLNLIIVCECGGFGANVMMGVQRRWCVCDTDVVGKTPDYARGEGLMDSEDSEESDAEPGKSLHMICRYQTYSVPVMQL